MSQTTIAFILGFASCVAGKLLFKLLRYGVMLYKNPHYLYIAQMIANDKLKSKEKK